VKKIKTKKLNFKKGTVTELNNIEMSFLNSGSRTIMITNINIGPKNVIFTNTNVHLFADPTQTLTQTGPTTTNSLLCP
jgi:hypothetical protein